MIHSKCILNVLYGSSPSASHFWNPRQLTGVVISDKADKTITVKVERKVKHPTYSKIMKRSTKVHAHDEANVARIGDVVTVQECKPYSKSKTWKLLSENEAAVSESMSEDN